MRSIILATSICAVLTLAACGGGGSNNNSPAPAPKTLDLYDTSMCQGPVPAGQTIEGRWYSGGKFPGLTSYKMILDIGTNSTTFTAVCGYPDKHVVQSSITAPSQYDSAHYVTSKAELDSGGCSIRQSASTIAYSLVGPCLKFTFQNQSHFLVPNDPFPDQTEQSLQPGDPSSTANMRPMESQTGIPDGVPGIKPQDLPGYQDDPNFQAIQPPPQR